MGAFVWWLGSVGVAIWVGMVAVTVLNLLAALILYRVIRRRGESLGFPATLRSLRSASPRTDTAKGKSQ
jgi:membrane protein implicated in regulation of membrane protease activity